MEIFRRYRKIFKSCIEIRGIFYIEKPHVYFFYMPQRGYISLLQEDNLILKHSTCNMCARVKSTFKNELDEDIEQKISALCESIKDERISYQQLEEIISVYEKTNYTLQYSISILLLKSCGELLSDVAANVRQDLANRVWNILVKRKYKLIVEHYNTLLSVLEENSQFINPDMFLREMTVKPNSNTYYLLLIMASKAGNEESVIDVISKLMENNMSLNEGAYNSLIRMYATNGNIEKALEVIKSMEDKNIIPSSETYAKLAYGYAKLGNVQSLIELLEKHKFATQDLIAIIKILSVSGHGALLPDVLKYFRSLLPTDVMLIKKGLVELIREDRTSDAHMIILSLLCKCEEQTERELISFLIKELIKLDSPVQRILEFVKDMTNIKHTYNPILKVTEFVLCEASDTICCAILEEIHKRNIEVRPHYYWPLLINTFKVKGENGVYAILQHASSLNVDLDNETFKDYVFPYINTTEPIIMLQKIQKSGISSKRIFTSLIIFLIENTRLMDCIDIYNRTHIKIDCGDIIKPLAAQCTRVEHVDKCITLLQTLSNSEQKFLVDFLIYLVNIHERNNFEPNVITTLLGVINEMKVGLSDLHKKVILTNCKHMSIDDNHTISQLLISNSEFIDTKYSTENHINYTENLSSSELSCHLIELQSKGMNLRSTMRKLIIKYCKENNIKKVQQLATEFDHYNFKWSAGMRSNLFDLYSCNNMVKEAEDQLKILRTLYTNFEIDKFKIIAYVNALIKVDRIEEAITTIQQYKYAAHINGNVYCWKLLKTICNSTHRNRIMEVLIHLLQNGYCTMDNRVLGPIIKASILEKDLENAVIFFKKCAHSYKMLPLKQELLSELIKQNKSNRVTAAREIHYLITNILGKDIANACLLIALAECEKIQSAENFLEKTIIPSERLVNQIQSLPDEKRLKVSLELFKANKIIPNVNTACVCEIILSIYSKLGNCNDAISLWKEMKAQHVIPTSNFKTGLINLLKAHKFSVPEDIYEDETLGENSRKNHN